MMNEHDQAFQNAKDKAQVIYGPMDAKELRVWQTIIRRQYAQDGPLHRHVAALKVISACLEEFNDVRDLERNEEQ